MSDRRRRPRLSELKSTLQALRESGMQPTALDNAVDELLRLDDARRAARAIVQEIDHGE